MWLGRVHEVAHSIADFPTTFDANAAGPREVQLNLEAPQADLIQVLANEWLNR
jgi:hypothetical protein